MPGEGGHADGATGAAESNREGHQRACGLPGKTVLDRKAHLFRPRHMGVGQVPELAVVGGLLQGVVVLREQGLQEDEVPGQHYRLDEDHPSNVVAECSGGRVVLLAIS